MLRQWQLPGWGQSLARSLYSDIEALADGVGALISARILYSENRASSRS